jgi:hypothetical protein
MFIPCRYEGLDVLISTAETKLGTAATAGVLNAVTGVAEGATAATELYAAFDATDYDTGMKVDDGSGTQTVRVENALGKFKLWQDSLLKDVSYNVACWKLPADVTAGDGGAYADDGTDQFGGAGKCTQCAESGKGSGCVNDYYPLMQDASSPGQ